MIPLVYDVLNRWAKDDDFFSGLVKRYEQRQVVLKNGWRVII